MKLTKPTKFPDLNAIARRLDGAKRIVYDAETDGVDWRVNRIVGHVLTFSPDPADSFYLPVRHGGGQNMNEDKVNALIRKHAARSDLKVDFFNASFDLKMAHNDGIEFKGPLEDGSINGFLINEWRRGWGLDDMCRDAGVQAKRGDELYAHLASKFGGEAKRDQMANFWKLPGLDPIGVDYAVGDGTSTWQLVDQQQQDLDAPDPYIERNLRQVWAIECRVIRVLHRMTVRGIKIDEERLARVSALVDREYKKASAALPRDFNEKAPTHLKKLFSDAGIDDWPTTAKNNASFPEEWLILSEPGRRVVKARKLRHLKNSFLTPLIERHLFKGRVHTNFNQVFGGEFGTITGRLSSNEPNLQQIHKRDALLGSIFRAIFVPDSGYVWASADYNQIEPRLLAHYAQVRVLIEGYMADPPIDAHSAVARAAGIPRQAGKTLNQALLTGAGQAKATMMLQRPRAEAEKIVNDYFASMPEIRDEQKQSKRVYRSRGQLVSLLGRRARLNDPSQDYKALNRLLQCGNADVIKKAMADVDEYYASEGDTVHLLNNVHDDLCHQFPEELRRVYKRGLELMEDYGPGRSVELTVPLLVDAKEGANWAEATYGIATVREKWRQMGSDYDAPKSGRKVA